MARLGDPADVRLVVNFLRFLRKWSQLLARLALRIAELVTCSESSRLHLEGYIWGFAANALRAQGDLAGADEAFLRSDRLWPARRPADPEWLDGSRLLDLKAS
ncbi:MAG TPA: hypothetical protein VLV54_17960 [Thermoanaerobaculia bacterium]|nr:hypothetical protein [Thermoanaerobaculia bacterium]